MVVSVGKATSADYYVGGGAAGPGAESYYLDAVQAGEPAGTWSGSGAAELGLTGQVDPEDMRVVFGEFTDPATGEAIGSRPAQHRTVAERLDAALAREPDALPERIAELRAAIERTDRRSVIGWDATFSVAKSVTVAHTAVHRAELAAIRAGDTDRADRFAAIREQIEAGIDAGNAAMLRYAETLTTARSGGGAGAPTEWVAAPGLTVASFLQHTSRNIDPQLHVHNVILNRAFCEDGKVRALDGADLLAQKHALGAIADRVLEEQLTKLGFEIALRPDGTARELTIVPEQVADLFSSRSRQVTARVGELVDAAQDKLGRELTDLELDRLKRQATLSTRAAKDHHPSETTEEMLERWNAQTRADIGVGLDGVAGAIAEHLDRHSPASSNPTINGDIASAADAGWSPSAVISEAVAACSEQRASWRRADLMLELSRRLPSLGGLDADATIRVLDRLADEALASDEVVQVAGRSATDHTDDCDVAGEPDRYVRPSAKLFAGTGTLLAEESLRRAAVTRGRTAADAAHVDAWLDVRCPSIGADQRAAVAGIATSDAALTVLIGPAGTGKSYAAGALAGAWTATTGGTVYGLAVSQIATSVLRDDGITASRNISQWLATQDRLTGPDATLVLEDGVPVGDDAWRLGPRDVVLVDEASMVATADLSRVRELVDAAGARLVLTGDPHQLGAVEAGGVMGLLDGHAETYTLAEVRRFSADWEAAASLALRGGSVDALAEYDRHGRLVDYDDTATALEAAARAAVADRLDGRSVVVVTGTNAEAAAVAARVRAQLVELGQVDEGGVLLGRDGLTAGAGDVVACRRNDYALGVTNRALYRVTAVGDDGSLTVEPLGSTGGEGAASMAPVVLPVEYVADDVQLGYASTAHAAQGVTVDAAHVVTDGTLDGAGLYVGLTRGRHRNTAHVATTPDTPDLPGGFGAVAERPSARAVLEGCFERDTRTRAATSELEADEEQRSSTGALLGRREGLVRSATRERMERHLDQLVTDGALDEATRAKLCADQGSEHLARVLRAVEQAGGDPRETLRTAVTARALGDAESVAQVLSHRITRGHELDIPIDADALPADLHPDTEQRLQHLNQRISDRRAVLGERVAADAPAWAVDAFGPVPDEAQALARWQDLAGKVAAHREATGWIDERRAIGPMPGLSATERRASYVAAWEALGCPATGLTEAAMSDGQLRVRARAAEAQQAWAPPHADAALRHAEAAAEAARHAAALADAAADHATKDGDLQRADELRAEADAHRAEHALRAAAAERLTTAADARGQWAAATAVTLDNGRRAKAELEARGLAWGEEPDRTTAEEWLVADREARQADDPHRVITEVDIADDTAQVAQMEPAAADDEPASVAEETPARSEYDEGAVAGDVEGGVHEDEPAPAEQERARQAPAHAVVSVDPSPAELDAVLASASLAVARAADEASAQAAHEAMTDVPEVAEAERRRRDTGHQLVSAAAPVAVEVMTGE